MDASSFFALYDFVGTDPDLTNVNFQQASAVTANYINDYMIAFFDFADETNLVDVETRIDNFLTDPVRIGFDVKYRFGEDSTRVPSQQQLDNLLIQAFQQPNVQALLFALRGLPASNPFSTAVDVSYTSEDGTVFLEERSTMSTAGVIATAAACLLVASVAGLVATNRAKRRRFPLHNGTKSTLDAPQMVVESEGSEETMSECTVSIARPPSPNVRHSPSLKIIDEEKEACFSSMKEGRRVARGYGYVPESKGEDRNEDEDKDEEGQ